MLISLLVLSVLCSATAQIMLKLGTRSMETAALSMPLFLARAAFEPRVLLGAALHVVALVLWLLALRDMDVSYAYPFVALGFVVVLIVSGAWLREAVNLYRLMGVACIILGTIFVARS